jgi:hypothetical protein
MHRNSNRTVELAGMTDVSRRITEGDQTDLPGIYFHDGVTTKVSRGQTSDIQQRVVTSFRAGATISKLAVEQSISESTVKRILRLHGASRRR